MINSWRCPGCRDEVILTRTQRLRAHDDPRTGEACPGKGYCIDEPEYPQLIKLWGWETGQRLMDQQNPTGWVSPTKSGPHPIGALQGLIMAAYPIAGSFGYAAGKGITFCVSRWWYYAASDGHVGEKYRLRSDAADALHEYMKGK
ncbi:hypothetical protein ACIQPQ_31430 [Streptomyces sp. NPDC091281]|uniref:hypothetical protein n=1 Tax=Streptomyces sp. NPDC091281 TaxID=3365985 RepID=UPI00382B8C1F